MKLGKITIMEDGKEMEKKKKAIYIGLLCTDFMIKTLYRNGVTDNEELSKLTGMSAELCKRRVAKIESMKRLGRED